MEKQSLKNGIIVDGSDFKCKGNLSQKLIKQTINLDSKKQTSENVIVLKNQAKFQVETNIEQSSTPSDEQISSINNIKKFVMEKNIKVSNLNKSNYNNNKTSLKQKSNQTQDSFRIEIETDNSNYKKKSSLKSVGKNLFKILKKIVIYILTSCF